MEDELEVLGYSGDNDDGEKWTDWEWGKRKHQPDLAAD